MAIDTIALSRRGRALLRLRRAAAPLALLGSGAAASCMIASPAARTVGVAPARLRAMDVRFESGSGSTIHGWFAAGRPGRGAVLLLHGVGESRRVMLPRAEFLHDAGYTVLLTDFQAHGESPGKHVTYGARESLDARAALAFLRSRACGERIGVIGVSMGGAAALLGAGPLPADALVLESVYPTIDAATADRLGTWLGPLGFAGRLVSPAVVRFVGWRVGVRAAELRPIDRIAEARAPLLLLAGGDDPYTPIAESRALFAQARSPKEMWEVPGATHEDLHAFAPAEYERRVGGFLARHLRAPSAVVAAHASASSGNAAHPERALDAGDAPECLGAQERAGDGERG